MRKQLKICKQNKPKIEERDQKPLRECWNGSKMRRFKAAPDITLSGVTTPYNSRHLYLRLWTFIAGFFYKPVNHCLLKYILINCTYIRVLIQLICHLTYFNYVKTITTTNDWRTNFNIWRVHINSFRFVFVIEKFDGIFSKDNNFISLVFYEYVEREREFSFNWEYSGATAKCRIVWKIRINCLNVFLKIVVYLLS